MDNKNDFGYIDHNLVTKVLFYKLAHYDDGVPEIVFCYPKNRFMDKKNDFMDNKNDLHSLGICG